MAPQATSVACVHPSSVFQDEKNKKNKENDNENLQGPLLRQNPSRAMAPQATSVACVHPSSSFQDKKGETEEDKKNENENFQGRLLRQNPSRAMTPQATSAACVNPWQGSDARPKAVLESPDSLLGRPRARGGARRHKRVQPPGSCASRTAPTTTRGSSLPGAASNSFLQKSSGGSAGNPGCSRARRRAPTVAFDLFRLPGHLVQ